MLKNKDKYGVWYSTQTTVNVLDALILLQKSTEIENKASAEKAEIFVNGKKVREFSFDATSLSNPLFFDVSPFLSETTNRIEIKNAGNLNFTQAQIVAAHYIPWKDFSAEDSRYFDLKVDFDKTDGENRRRNKLCGFDCANRKALRNDFSRNRHSAGCGC